MYDINRTNCEINKIYDCSPDMMEFIVINVRVNNIIKCRFLLCISVYTITVRVFVLFLNKFTTKRPGPIKNISRELSFLEFCRILLMVRGQCFVGFDFHFCYNSESLPYAYDPLQMMQCDFQNILALFRLFTYTRSYLKCSTFIAYFLIDIY